jgi:hypothetical protein
VVRQRAYNAQTVGSIPTGCFNLYLTFIHHSLNS